VMFVCMGNICRSPMAEGVFRQLVKDRGLADRFEIASAATGHWHLGNAPHAGTRKELAKHGISLPGKTAQKLTAADLQVYDYIVAMDEENVQDVRYAFNKELPRLLDYVDDINEKDVPDPYYSGNFERVYDLVVAGCQGLLNHILKQEQLQS